MSQDNQDSLSALAKDVLSYIQQEHSYFVMEKKVPPPPLKPVPKPVVAKKEERPEPVKKEDSSFRLLIESALPELRLSDKVPSDAKAKALAQLYKKKSPQVGLLSFEEEHLGFFKALAKAIHEKLAPAKIWEGTKFEPVEGLRLIICTRAGVEPLKSHLRESPTPTLFDVPLILLAPPSEYENNPSLKRALWNHLCQTLQSPTS